MDIVLCVLEGLRDWCYR